MRFSLEYKDYKTIGEENINIKLLDTFLNEYTIDTYCGDTFKGIDIKFLNNASSKRVEKIKIENMDFNLENLMNSLKIAEKNLFKSKEELEGYGENIEAIKRNNTLRLVNYNIKRDKDSRTELNKPLHGIRVYSDLKFEGINLEPYLFIYENIFSNLLRRERIMLPGYNEIYLYIHRTLDEEKVKASHPAVWSKNTYGEIDVEKYQSSTEKDKAKMVFDSVCQGLRIISDFNHLDKDAIEKVIKVIEREGIETELIYTIKENKNYVVKVAYILPKVAREKAIFKLKIKDKNTGKEGRVDIGYINRKSEYFVSNFFIGSRYQ